MTHVYWFTDGAGNAYDVSFQMVPDNYKMTKGISKELNTLFTVTSPIGRIAYFAGTLDNELRYYFTPTSPRIEDTERPAPYFSKEGASKLAPYLLKK